MEQYRQGDVFIERIDGGEIVDNRLYVEGDVRNRIDLTEVPADKGRVILAYGEVTGHAHALDAQTTKLFGVKEWVDRILLVAKTTALMHEEHAPITLAPGIYRIRQQREYVPGRVPQNVAD